MAGDEFDVPLGTQAAPARRKLPFSPSQIAVAALGAVTLAVLAWTISTSDPTGGEPVAVVPTHPGGSTEAKAVTAAVQDAGKPASSARDADPASASAAIPPGARTVTIIDGSSGSRQEVVLPGQGGSPQQGSSAQPPAGAVDQKFLDISRHGAIPKIAADGSRPLTAFAHPISLPDGKKNLPRISIVIASLGVSASGTAQALDRLPGAVTFALTPYGPDVERLADQATAKNHEVLLQVPMEPFDYPDNDPGPQTLLTSLNAEQNIDRLHWQMSRMKGYVGIISFMGAKFSSSDAALSPVIREASKRGLIYIDNAASQRSVASQIAGSQNIPFARADVVIDAVPSAAEIDRALAKLETAAHEHGAAVGIAAALPAVVARIADWTKNVEARGVVLVPISMVAVKAKQS